jgi:hypothetical protein
MDTACCFLQGVLSKRNAKLHFFLPEIPPAAKYGLGFYFLHIFGAGVEPK